MSTQMQGVSLRDDPREQEREREGGKSNVRAHYQGHCSWHRGMTSSAACPKSILESSQNCLNEGQEVGWLLSALVAH